MPILNMVAQGSSSGGGGNIGEPLNLTVTASGLDATIKWEDNEIGTIPPTTFQKSELVRKIGSAPTSPSDGDLVVTETVKDTYKTTGYVDQGLTDGETYYYRVFSYSDLGGISYCDAVSVTPSQGGWQPGVNTIAYYPLDSVNTVNDLSSNNYTLTSSGTISYGTYDGVDCCSLSGQLTSAINSVSFTPGVTISIWYKFNSAPNSDNGQIIALNNGTVNQHWLGAMLCYGRPQADGNIAATSDRPYPYGAYDKTNWTHICITCDNTVKLYLNGILVGSNSRDSNWGTRQGLNIGFTQKNPNCYVSKAIFEDKVRTAQEISNYYDQTKGDYGIS